MDRVSVDFHIADAFPHGLNHGQDSEFKILESQIGFLMD